MTTSLKTCFKCGTEKPLTEFYRHPMMGDGHLNKCKKCTKKDTRENRRKRIDYYRKYDLQRYRDNPKRREATLRWFKEKMALHPAAKKASDIVSNAIRDGRMKRQPCEVCGDPKSEAHHPDYAKPLDVMWLCRSHHVQWHHKHGPGKNADMNPNELSSAA